VIKKILLIKTLIGFIIKVVYPLLDNSMAKNEIIKPHHQELGKMIKKQAVILSVFLSIISVVFSCTAKPEPFSAVPNENVNALSDLQEEIFSKQVIKVTENVYSAVGFALANSIMIKVEGGKVIVDTTEGVQAAQKIRDEFDKIAPGPVLAVIYTHTHPDHILGAKVFKDSGAPVWATAASIKALNDQFTSLSTILRKRGAKQYGEVLSDSERISNGIGPFLKLDSGPVPPIIYPTKTFTGKIRIEIGKTLFELVQAPGETEDQLFVWLPETKILLSGDNIYPSFPNLYATRGVPPRPVRSWIESLDKMRKLKPEHLVPSHAKPLSGQDKIYEVLTVYRDAIEYVHDSVIRMANQGKSPDDIAEEIILPAHLRNHPYLTEFYGKVSWSVRGIYDGYLGWFDGNPTSLNRLHPKERSKRLLPLMGGTENALKACREALENRNYQWAAELSDILLDVDPKDKKAKAIKAKALRALAMKSINSNERCYLISSAYQLEGRYKEPSSPKINSATIKDLPIGVLIANFPERLDYKKTVGITTSISFEFSDTGNSYTFFIRRGIGEVVSPQVTKADLKLISTEEDFKALLVGDLGSIKALTKGRIKIEGGLGKLIAFRSYLIRP